MRTILILLPFLFPITVYAQMGLALNSGSTHGLGNIRTLLPLVVSNNSISPSSLPETGTQGYVLYGSSLQLLSLPFYQVGISSVLHREWQSGISISSGGVSPWHEQHLIFNLSKRQDNATFGGSFHLKTIQIEGGKNIWIPMFRLGGRMKLSDQTSFGLLLSEMQFYKSKALPPSPRVQAGLSLNAGSYSGILIEIEKTAFKPLIFHLGWHYQFTEQWQLNAAIQTAPAAFFCGGSWKNDVCELAWSLRIQMEWGWAHQWTVILPLQKKGNTP